MRRRDSLRSSDLEFRQTSRRRLQSQGALSFALHSFTANPAPGVGAGAWTGPRATPDDTQLVATVANARAHTPPTLLLFIIINIITLLGFSTHCNRLRPRKQMGRVANPPICPGEAKILSLMTLNQMVMMMPMMLGIISIIDS